MVISQRNVSIWHSVQVYLYLDEIFFFPKKLQLVGGAVGMHISHIASSLDRLKEPPQIRTRDVIEREMFVNLVFMAEWC